MTKVALSIEELACFQNKEFFDLKRQIHSKITSAMNDICADLKDLCKNRIELHNIICNNEPKISRGENYLNYPYWILDYPRCFEHNNVFALRTMVWWGNEISFTLHISGTYKHIWEKSLSANVNLWPDDTYICVGESPWQYHFQKCNYQLTSSLTKKEITYILRKKNFIKLSRRIELSDFENIKLRALDSYKTFLELLRA